MSSMNKARAYQSESDDRLLLVENFHRVANEAAAALASLHLIRNARSAAMRLSLLETATMRIEGFAEVNRLLSLSFSRSVDLGMALDRLTRAIAAGRMVSSGGSLVLDVVNTSVDGGTARTVLLVAYELVVNAVRHALGSRGSELVVRLRRSGTDVFLEVSDDGPGIGASSDTSGTGLGGSIVAELVRRCGGRIECSSDALGTTFRVTVPTGAMML